jgi:diguanylate cyclase (GGDEF)-like protein
MENTDELTGLLNRKMFNKLYMDFLRRHREQKKTVFMMDIDSFKSINDTYGHLFGNAVLAMVGEKLRDAIKNRGMAARWGGDEFLGVLPLDVAEAEKIMRGFMDSLNGDEKAAPYRVTVSLGLAEFGGKLGVEQIIKMADEALYLSKENGRNKITVYGGKYSV